MIVWQIFCLKTRTPWSHSLIVRRFVLPLTNLITVVFYITVFILNRKKYYIILIILLTPFFVSVNRRTTFSHGLEVRRLVLPPTQFRWILNILNTVVFYITVFILTVFSLTVFILTKKNLSINTISFLCDFVSVNTRTPFSHGLIVRRIILPPPQFSWIWNTINTVVFYITVFILTKKEQIFILIIFLLTLSFLFVCDFF